MGDGETGGQPAAKMLRRWNTTTEDRYIDALTMCGVHITAARLIGVSADSAKYRRQNYPAFAERCERALAQFRDAQGDAHGERKGARATASAPIVFDGSPEACRGFLMLLAEHGGVRTAAGKAGVSVASLFDVRDRDPAFAAAWARALQRYAESARTEALSIAMGRLATEKSPAALKLVLPAIDRMEAGLAPAAPGEEGELSEHELEAMRLELGTRMQALVDKYGDPFGDDPERPARLGEAA